MRSYQRTFIAALGVALLWATGAAAVTDADKCEAAKLKRAGQYSACRLKAESKAVKTGDAPDYSKCDSKLSDKWTAAETDAGGMCPTNGDLASMQARITGDANDVAACLNGTCPPSLAAALLATGQTTSYGPGTDGDVQAGAALSYTDNGDGTITDNNTGLMWEKKSDDSSIHDWDNPYTWCDDTPLFDGVCDTPGTMDGTIKTAFLDTLNDVSGGGTSCFAGHCDWRLPNLKELQSFLNYQNVNPPISAAFNNGCVPACTVLTCSCTQPDVYWSSTTHPTNTNRAWTIFFTIGESMPINKTEPGFHARAVRGGL